MLCLIQTGKFRSLCGDSRLWALLDILSSLGIEPRVGKSRCRGSGGPTQAVWNVSVSPSRSTSATQPHPFVFKCGGGGGGGDTLEALAATVPLTNPYLSPASMTPRSGIITSVHTWPQWALAPSLLREGTLLPAALSPSSVPWTWQRTMIFAASKPSFALSQPQFPYLYCKGEVVVGPSS